jgi:hypothetical protein
MKKPSSKIREEIARLQEHLKAAETREADRIGRIALKAGLGEIEVEDTELQAAFEQVAHRFRAGSVSHRKEPRGNESGGADGNPTPPFTPDATAGNSGEA